MKIDPIERYTVLKITTYPNGERLAEPVVDDEIFSSQEEANEFLREILKEEFKDYCKQYHPCMCTSVYEGHENIDSCASAVIYCNKSKARVDLYTISTKFVFPDKSF